GWRVEPGWRGPGSRPEAPWLEGERGTRPGFRPSGGGGWRATRGRTATDRAPAGTAEAPRDAGFAAGPALGTPAEVFQTGEIADRGPLERGTIPAPEPRARDARELDRQREWRESARRAIQSLHADEGTAPVPPDDDEAEEDEDEADLATDGPVAADGDASQAADGYASVLPTLHVLPFGISRKRLEQAVRELQLPVLVARTVDDADVVITLRSQYRQKPSALREAEERTLPIYVLKSNTVLQMEACLTSLYALQADPREAAMRETEEAITLVMRDAKPIELSPQNAYIRRLQHQMAERANLVSRSRGREPFRRVRLYPDQVRAWR
ncbi:MAG TPA: R3H domain-containing nucleic acid-binding protein, partial [Candidatus Sulfotelmatobacter sp.]|nr:R3H domain-containing nucleic acid-binding protein [Candidatus Sulfotelmatobacter sp.]